MTTDGGAADELYRRLAEGDAATRTEEVLRLLAEGVRLELPARDGHAAVLNGVDLSRQALLGRVGPAPPPWWDGARQAANLGRADLRGASLKRANLAAALLEEADLSGADLAGADLQGVDLAGARLAGALLEEVDLRRAVLRFARGPGCVLEGSRLQGADLWGAELGGAALTGADLRGARLEETDLKGADLRRADLRGAVLMRADLKGANLGEADLRGASLAGADLAGCVLRRAKLQELDLTGCTVTHVHLGDAWLDRTRLERGQLGGALGEELAGDYGPAARGYLALERNFEQSGDHDASGWAYRRRRRMRKLEARRQAGVALRGGRRREAVRHAVRYAADQFVEWLCDYGESVPRVLASLLAVFVGFAVFYGVTGSVVRVGETPHGTTRTVTYHPRDLAVFSLMSMTTSGPPPTLAPRSDAVYLAVGTQALLGIGLTGLLGFVIGNRIRR